ncbi:hypothetical protein F4810DRAFT_710823 [Camillea tinctor]|nr:hypothetical protein F4810DRAFT_710823 [Camillea tinctor]
MSAEDDPRVRYGLSCPEGGEIRICADSEVRFIGCCDEPAEDVCSGNATCSGTHLFPASFSAAKYSDFLPQNCVAPYNESYWYTCMNARPPFIGCCRNNPCNGGCADVNLIPARLSDIEENAAQFLAPAASSTSPSVTETATMTAEPSPTETPSGSQNIGVIVGPSMAGVVILLVVVGFYLWWRRREERRRTRGHDSPPDSDGEADEQQQQQHHPQPEMMTRPPSTFTKDMLSPASTPSTAAAFPSPYQDTFPGKSQRSPALSSSSRTPGGFSSWGTPPPSDGVHDIRSGHASQLSELSGDSHASDWIQMHDRMTAGMGGGVQELEGSRVERRPVSALESSPPPPPRREYTAYRPHMHQSSQEGGYGYGYQQVRQDYESG